MNKYSIISVVNSAYIKFAFIFLKSALNTLNLEKVHEICLLNTGLEHETVDKFTSLSNKIKVINADTVHNSFKSWDTGWQENVLLKTEFARKYILQNKIPTCMVDIDSMFIRDLSPVLETTQDIILCDRSEVWGGMPFIGSFVGFRNTNVAIKFIDEWRSRMETMVKKGFQTRETPALNELVKMNREYKFSFASHRKVGLYKPDLLTNDTIILHFKGAGDSENKPMEEAIDIRLQRFKYFKEHISFYLDNV